MKKIRALFTSIVLVATMSGASLFGSVALVSTTSLHAAGVTSANHQIAVKRYPLCPYPGQTSC